MSMEHLQEAFDLIEKHFANEEKSFGKKASQEVISNAEKEIELTFPNTYRKFLEMYGYGGINDLDIDGITQYDFQGSGQGGIVWRILNDRKKFSFPLYLIPIYEIGEGTTYCLDTSQMNKNNECPVVAWSIGGYEQIPVLELIAKDFGEFFLNEIKEQINRKNH